MMIVFLKINSQKNAHEVTLRAVLEIMFMCSCTHMLRWQRLKMPQASRVLQYVYSKQNRMSAPSIHTENIHTMQDSFLNCIFTAKYSQTLVHFDLCVLSYF